MKKSLMGVRSAHIWIVVFIPGVFYDNLRTYCFISRHGIRKFLKEIFLKLTCRKSSPKESGLRVARLPMLLDMAMNSLRPPFLCLPLGLYLSRLHEHERPLITAYCMLQIWHCPSSFVRPSPSYLFSTFLRMRNVIR